MFTPPFSMFKQTEQMLVFRCLLAESNVAVPGVIYRLFSSMLNAVDLGWLSPVPYEALEKRLAALKK
jgi:hypothetical protein